MNLPEGAIRVRADEVRPGDQFWSDGENVGPIVNTYTSVYMQPESRFEAWVLVVGREDARSLTFYRNCDELVWVVRPEPTVTLTITLPEKIVRGIRNDPHTEKWVAPLFRAAAEWIAANPQDGDPK